MHHCDESPLVSQCLMQWNASLIRAHDHWNPFHKNQKKQHLSAISPSAAEQVPAVKESNVKSNHQTARYSFRCLIDSSSAWVTRLSKRPFGGKHMFVRVHCSPEFASTYPWISESLEERSTWAHHANNAWLDATSTSKKAWYDDVMHKNNTE